ncbi:hypothetical protein Ahy_B08g090813 isoform F [Arachis hypogaea]|uniref:Uncharacterized protein n=1 Tax=Arachis hypogaea TaxID=3818 RepID=A0A444Y0N4_ARAHY|nr:hypothetical protein Ahy_B08g090813 isoform F [Arachis hypogaea]
MSPTLFLHMLHMLLIAIGKGLRVLVAIVNLEGQPCWSLLIQVSRKEKREI